MGDQLQVQPAQGQGSITSVGTATSQQPLPAAPSAAPAQPQQPQVDPQALALTHAIALAETGSSGTPDYKNTTGDNGTSFGAYQWNGPGKFASDAKAAGLDPSDTSPENQDKVAYYAVKKMKDAGLQPAQIAAQWNSGNPSNFVNHSGNVVINGKTIHYDTPAYVQKVKANYNKLSAADSSQASQPAQGGAAGAASFTPWAAPQQQEQQQAGMNQGGGVGGFLTNLARPELSALASGIRAIQATPQIAEAVGGAIGNIGNPNVKYQWGGLQPGQTPTAGERASQAASATMKKPALGVRPFAGNTVQQNLGEAAQVAGQGLMAAGAPVWGAGAQTLGSDVEQGKSGQQTAIDTGATLAGGGLLKYAGGPLMGAAYNALPEGVQGAIEGAGNAVSEGLGKLAPAVDAAGSAVPSWMKNSIMGMGGPSTALEDVTPSFTKKLVGEPNVEMPSGGTAPRVSEGGGLAGGRTVNPTMLERDAANALGNVPNYPAGGSALEKYQAIQPEIAKQGDALMASLKEEGILRPPQAIMGVVNNAVNDIPNTSLLLSKSDPVIQSYLRVAQSSVDANDGTLAGELGVRQDLDAAYENARGKLAYGSDKISSLDEVHTAARDALNQDIADRSQSTDVKTSLKNQWDLYRAGNALRTKAESEAGSTVGRFMQNNPVKSALARKLVNLSGLGEAVHIATGGG